GFFIVSNCASVEGFLQFAQEQRFWDTAAKKLLGPIRRLKLTPFSLRLLRILDHSPGILDVLNAITLIAFREDETGAELKGMFHRQIELLSARQIAAIELRAENEMPAPAKYSQSRRRNHWQISISDLPLEDIDLSV